MNPTTFENLFAKNGTDLRCSSYDLLQQTPDATWATVESAAFNMLWDRLAVPIITQQPLNGATLASFVETFRITLPDPEGEDDDEDEELDDEEPEESSSSSDESYQPVHKKAHVESSQ